MDREFKAATNKRYAKGLFDKNLFKEKFMRRSLLDSVCRTHYQDVRVVGDGDNTWKVMDILHKEYDVIYDRKEVTPVLDKYKKEEL
jgi:hypothetical protein